MGSQCMLQCSEQPCRVMHEVPVHIATLAATLQGDAWDPNARCNTEHPCRVMHEVPVHVAVLRASL